VYRAHGAAATVSCAHRRRLIRMIRNPCRPIPSHVAGRDQWACEVAAGLSATRVTTLSVARWTAARTAARLVQAFSMTPLAGHEEEDWPAVHEALAVAPGRASGFQVAGPDVPERAARKRVLSRWRQPLWLPPARTVFWRADYDLLGYRGVSCREPMVRWIGIFASCPQRRAPRLFWPMWP